MRVLITGGAGFIGRNLTDHFVDHEVHILDNLSSGTEPRPWANLHVVDIRDRPAVAALIPQVRPDLVIHCAAQVSVSASVQDPELDRAVNLDGTVNLLDALSFLENRPHFVFLSSCSVYGTSAEPDEDTHLDPLSPYARNKMLAEEAVLAADHVRPLVLRLANIYGVGQKPPAMVPAIVAAAVASRAFRLEGDGSQERDLLNVRDLGRAIMLLIGNDSGPRLYNVGSGQSVCLNDVIAATEAVLSKSVALDRVASRVGDIHISRPRVERLLAQTAFAPAVTLSEGLREICTAVSSEGAAD